MRLDERSERMDPQATTIDDRGSTPRRWYADDEDVVRRYRELTDKK